MIEKKNDRRIVICTIDDSFERTVREVCRRMVSSCIMERAESFNQLMGAGYYYGKVICLCDKFFLGIHPEQRITYLKTTNPELKVCVLDNSNQQECLIYRLHKMGVDGFINEMENIAKLEKSLETFLDIGIYFPQEMNQYFSNGGQLLLRDFVGDITPAELKVALQKINGLTSKQMNGTKGAVDMKFRRFKKKIGITSFADTMSWIKYLHEGAIL